MNIKRLSVLSFARFQAVLFGLLGLVAGIVYGFGGLMYDLFTSGINVGSGLAMLALLGMPILFAIIGYLAGILEAVLFNGFVDKMGGLTLDFEV